jgi:hypothetical protein
MNRRGFFQRLIGATLAAKFAPLLPKFLPKYYEVSIPISIDEINAVTMASIMPGIADNFFKDSPMLAYLRDKQPGVHWHGAPILQENFLYPAPQPNPIPEFEPFHTLADDWDAEDEC